MRNFDFDFPANMLCYSTIPYRLFHQKTSIVGELHLRGLTVNAVLLGISLQERQEHVVLSHFGGVVDDGGKSGNKFCSIVLSGLRSEVWERVGAWGGMGAKSFPYKTDVVIGGLRRGMNCGRVLILEIEDR